MGKRRVKSVKHPPPAPSSEKEEDTSGGAEDSSPEEEAPKTLTPTPTPKSRLAKPQPSNTKTPIPTPTPKSPPAKPQPSNTKTPIPTQNNDSCSEESESETRSGSESESDADEKEVGQQAAPTAVGATTTPVGEKRGASSEASGIPVGKKLMSEDGKKPFQRIWSDGDEVAVLEGMIEHKMKTGNDPVADINAFSDFIMGKLDSQFSLSQLKDKIQRMKKKFRKQCSTGENMTFPNAQQQKLYDLSKSYWGIAGGGRGKWKIEDVENDLGIVKAKRVKYDAGFHAAVDMGDFVTNKWFELLDADKRAEVDDEWKKLQLDELNLYTRKLELLKKRSVLVAAAMQD